MVLPPETTLPDLSEVQHMKLDIVVDFELDCIGILPMSCYRCLAVELWNGSSWTEVNDLNTGRYDTNGAGADGSSQLCAGGFTTTYVAVTEEFSFPPPTSAWLI